jgi:hypothetical protein
MKMEIRVAARRGQVKRLLVSAGEMVERGQLLVSLSRDHPHNGAVGELMSLVFHLTRMYRLMTKLVTSIIGESG